MSNDLRIRNNTQFSNSKAVAESLNYLLENLDLNKITDEGFLELLSILQITEDLINSLEKKFLLKN